jgi:hypothetical protein
MAAVRPTIASQAGVTLRFTVACADGAVHIATAAPRQAQVDDRRGFLKRMTLASTRSDAESCGAPADGGTLRPTHRTTYVSEKNTRQRSFCAAV